MRKIDEVADKAEAADRVNLKQMVPKAIWGNLEQAMSTVKADFEDAKERMATKRDMKTMSDQQASRIKELQVNVQVIAASAVEDVAEQVWNRKSERLQQEAQKEIMKKTMESLKRQWNRL